ncbi:MAG: carbohydrate ABC transporter permease [Lachnospiraceae bacterium]|nr:carbohydrate ABC transporter permease [Lachnospiraceae bacterium]
MYTMKRKGYVVCKYVLYAGLLLFLIFPLYWIVTTAFRTDKEIVNSAMALIPRTFTLEHFRAAVVEVDLLKCLKNSLVVTLITVVISLATGLLMAYAFARFSFRGKNFLNMTILFTQFIPAVAYIIPLYLIMSKMKMLNTYPSLWITYLGSAFPVTMVLLVNYIRDVPVSLEEAARIDGCSRFQVMMHITFPLSVPGIVSTSIYVFISIWQEYLIAVSFISNEKLYTVSMALTRFQGPYGTDWGGIMAGALIISIPAIALFLCTRKMFTNNLVGGIKG